MSHPDEWASAGSSASLVASPSSLSAAPAAVHLSDAAADDAPAASASAPSRGSLYARGGGASTPRAVVLGLIAFVTLGYSAAMVFNALLSRVTPPRVSAGSPGGWLIARVLDPVFLIGATRALPLAAILTALARYRGATVFPPAPPGADAWAPAVASGVTNCAGYAFYLALTALDGVAVWSAMAGLYVVVPCVYFTVVGAESRGPRKLAGIAACVAAALLLGVGKGSAPADADAPGAGGSALVKVALLAGTVLNWGACDATQVIASRRMHPAHTAAYAGFGFAGFAVAALVAGWAVSALTADAVLPPEGPRASAAARVAGWAATAFAQTLAMLAWLGISYLSPLSEASAFLPIVSLYTIVSAVVSLGLTGETLNAYGWLGLVVGGAGILLLASG